MVKKIVLCFIGLGLFFVASINASASQEIFSLPLNGIDVSRAENTLIYYSYNATGKTPANQWGYEISVDKNHMVIQVAANVTMEVGGYSLSGHGSRRDALQLVAVGDMVEVDFVNMQVKVIRAPLQSAHLQAERGIVTANEKLAQTDIAMIDFNRDAVLAIIEEMTTDKNRIDDITNQATHTQADIDELGQLSQALNTKQENIIYMTSKPQTIELRALWHRPLGAAIKETNLENMKIFMDKIAELGFNAIYVEALWHGYVSHRSGWLETHPTVANYNYGPLYGNDYMAAFIGEANKRNIDVHAWTHVFNAGNASNLAQAVDPSWLVENYQGETLHPTTYGGNYYLDPSHPEVLDFIDNVFAEMVNKYNFAGIQLDYIRYYDNNYTTNPIKDSGYSDHADAAFKAATGLTGDVRQLILDTGRRAMWNTWRQQNITTAVKRFSENLRLISPEIIISADVVSDIGIARQTYMQDWLTWVQRGYIDLLCPMIYTGSPESVARQAEQLHITLGHLTYLSTGIAPVYYGYSVMTKHLQIEAAGHFGGSAIFASQNVIGNERVEFALKHGLYRTPAISPFAAVESIKHAVIDQVISYLETFSPNDPHTQTLKTQLNATKAMKAENAAHYQTLMHHIEYVTQVADGLTNPYVRAHVQDTLQQFSSTLNIRISRQMIALGYYAPINEERPNPSLFDYPVVGTSTRPTQLIVGLSIAGGALLVLGIVTTLWMKKRR